MAAPLSVSVSSSAIDLRREWQKNEEQRGGRRECECDEERIGEDRTAGLVELCVFQGGGASFLVPTFLLPLSNSVFQSFSFGEN